MFSCYSVYDFFPKTLELKFIIRAGMWLYEILYGSEGRNRSTKNRAALRQISLPAQSFEERSLWSRLASHGGVFRVQFDRQRGAAEPRGNGAGGTGAAEWIENHPVNGAASLSNGVERWLLRTFGADRWFAR